MSDITGGFGSGDLEGFSYSFNINDKDLDEGKVRVTFRSETGEERTFTMTCLKLKDLKANNSAVRLDKIVQRILEDSAPMLAASLNPKKIGLSDVEPKRVKKIDFTLSQRGLKDLKYSTSDPIKTKEEESLKNRANSLMKDTAVNTTAFNLYQFLHDTSSAKKKKRKSSPLKPLRPNGPSKSFDEERGVKVKEQGSNHEFSHRSLDPEDEEDDDEETFGVLNSDSLRHSHTHMGNSTGSKERPSDQKRSLFQRLVAGGEPKVHIGRRKKTPGDVVRLSFEEIEPSAPSYSSYLFDIHYIKYTNSNEGKEYETLFRNIKNDTTLDDDQKDYRRLALLGFIFSTEPGLVDYEEPLLNDFLPYQIEEIQKQLDALLKDSEFEKVTSSIKSEGERPLDGKGLQGKLSTLFSTTEKLASSLRRGIETFFNQLKSTQLDQEREKMIDYMFNRYQDHFKDTSGSLLFSQDDIKEFFRTCLKNVKPNNLDQLEQFLLYFEKNTTSKFDIRDFIILFPKKARGSLNGNPAFIEFKKKLFEAKVLLLKNGIEKILKEQQNLPGLSDVQNLFESKSELDYEFWILIEEKLAEINNNSPSSGNYRVKWSKDDKKLIGEERSKVEGVLGLLSDLLNKFCIQRSVDPSGGSSS